MIDRRSILALDIATTTGYAHSSGASGIVNLRDAGAETPARVKFLAEFLAWKISEFAPKLIAIEHSAFGAKSNQVREFHGRLRGVVELVASQHGIQIEPVNITTAKSIAAMNGRADKSQMMRAFRTFNRRDPADDNEADAWAVLVAAQQGAFSRPKPRRGRRPAKFNTRKPKPGRLF